jgi:hypothetical protein
MLYFHFKILLRYRQILFAPISIILGLLLFKYLLLPKNTVIRTVIPFSMFVFCVLGDLFNHLFDISSKEFRSYQLFPILYHKLIVMKNYATFIVVIIYSILISFFSVLIFHISPYNILLSFTYSLTICFPLAALGNLIFSQATRLNSLNYGLLRMLLNIFIVAILSLPYVIIKIAFMSILFCYAYIIVAMFFWWYVSIPIAAKQLSKNVYKLNGSI